LVLFNLDSDPGQKNNVVLDNPKTMKTLHALLSSAREDEFCKP